jgi:FHA domain/zinc-ribbon domain
MARPSGPTTTSSKGIPRVFCTACGTENPPGSHFCASCGAALPVAAGPAGSGDTTTTMHTGLVAPEAESDFSTDAHQGAVDALTPGSALLVVKRGPNAGSRFLLDQDVTTAGRHPDSDIFLDDVTVSRRHAEFRREGSGYTVHDVGSLNGTYVNRERVDAAPLSGGDEVQIGKFRLVYLTAAVRAGARAAGAPA